MIVLEGPDGSGKTTLLGMLQVELGIPVHERFSTSTGGPIDNIFMAGRQDLLTWRDQEFSLYDRHPMISEPIYGAVLRGDYDERFDILRVSNRLLLMRGLVIFCIPPYEIARQGATVEDQLSGVVDNFEQIYHAYVRRAAEYKGRSFIYNYNDPESYGKLMGAIARYLEERKKHVG